MIGCGTLLEILRHQPEASRSELAERTGLARSTVGQRLELLAAMGYVEEAGPRPSTGGRPAATVRFSAAGGLVLACDLGATHCRLAVTDLNRRVLAAVSHELPIAAGPEQVLGRVRKLLVALIERAGRRPQEVRAIGVGLPGPVEFASGRPVDPPIMPGWDGVDVPALLSAFGAPVLVDNDVNIMALGEHREHWSDCDDFLFVKVATGIGCGIITGGRMHRGAQGAAGDLGHVQVPNADALCRCGNRGCLEAIASGGAQGAAGDIGHVRVPDADALCRCGNRGCLEAIASGGALARRLSEQGVPVENARAVVEAAQAGEPLAVEGIRASGHTIGEAMAGMVNFFNPAVMVIGGDLAHAGDELLTGIRGAVYQRSLILATRDLKIVTSRLDEEAGVIGAATMATDGLFSPARVDEQAARALTR